VWQYASKDAGVVSVMSSAATGPKMVTPNNRLVGAVLVSQERVSFGACPAAANEAVNNYTRAANVQVRAASPAPVARLGSFISVLSLS
jgi:hypothetical protein